MMESVSLIRPELFLALAALAFLLMSAWFQKAEGIIYGCAGVMVIAALWIACADGAGVLLNGMIAVDDFRRFVKVIILLSGAAALLFAPSFFKQDDPVDGAYGVLALFASLGMLGMVSATHLLSFYVSFELQNLALYILVAMRRDNRASSEAGVKYFVLGALASGVMVFGLSWLYGFAGSGSYAMIASAADHAQGLGLGVGMIFVLAGLAFKVSLVPFHMWTPDVYDGAAAPVTGFLTAAPKIAAMAVLGFLLLVPFGGLWVFWQGPLAALALLSMFWGALAGLLQTHIKRLMAYSAILNMGTLLLAVLARDGQSLLLYLCVYVMAALGVMGGVSLIRIKGQELERIEDCAGLGRVHPVLAGAMALCLFSLAAVPPMAGFLGKFMVFFAAVKADFTGLAALGLLASVLAAAFYLRVVKVIYFEAPKQEAASFEAQGLPARAAAAAVVLLALASSFLMIYPGPLLTWTASAAESLL
ncbi:MAG: NADH-quinone oxidoreductase subunit N [Alphaproteobacteria bacterium]|nr:NADH-quinone oxidoreductase subunit N [Alphaproteobacteria bacterium]